MKKFILILLSIALSFSINSCSSFEVLDVNESKPDMVSVKFEPTGEFSIIRSPLNTKSDDSDDLYGIQVWEVSEKDKNDYEYDHIGTPYAYCLIDDPDEFEVTLIKGRKYTIEARCIIDGKNKLIRSDGSLGRPFCNNEHLPVEINEMYYSNSNSFWGLTDVLIETNYNNKLYTQTLDSYYGRTVDYVASKNENIKIDLYRMVFGITFNITNPIDSDEKDVVIRLMADLKSHPGTPVEGYDYSLKIKPGETKQLSLPLLTIMDEYSLFEQWKAIVNNENDHTAKMKIAIGEEEKPTKYFLGDVDIFRNTMHTINFTIKDDSIEQEPDLNLENKDMENKEINID